MIANLKPYPAMKYSGVTCLGEVPEHWEVSALRRKLRTYDGIKIGPFGSQLKLEQMSPSGYKVYGQANVIARDFARGTKFVDQEKFNELSACEVLPSDLLVTMMGTSGRCAYVPDDASEGIMDSHLLRLRTDFSINVRFASRIIDESPYVKEQISVTGKGSIMHGLNSGIVKALVLALPPLPEQAAIVRFLDHADRRIRRYIRAKQKLIKLLEEQKQAIIHQAVTGRIDVRTGQPYPAYKPSRVEWIEDVPEHWEVRRLKSKLRPVDRRSSSGTETLLSLRRDFGVVVYAEHFSRPPQGVTLVGYKLVEAGQLVVNRLQANNGLLFCSRLSGVVSPDYSVFAARSPVDMEYLGNLLRTVTYKTHFRRESTGLGTGRAGFLRLYDDRLLETPVALPPLEEQSTLLVSLSEITASLCRAIGRQHVGIALLREYRTRLIADVVTGKLDVREAAARLPEVDSLANEFDALTTQAAETGVMELEGATESPEEFAMENEATV